MLIIVIALFIIAAFSKLQQLFPDSDDEEEDSFTLKIS